MFPEPRGQALSEGTLPFSQTCTAASSRCPSLWAFRELLVCELSAAGSGSPVAKSTWLSDRPDLCSWSTGTALPPSSARV